MSTPTSPLTFSYTMPLFFPKHHPSAVRSIFFSFSNTMHNNYISKDKKSEKHKLCLIAYIQDQILDSLNPLVFHFHLFLVHGHGCLTCMYVCMKVSGTGITDSCKLPGGWCWVLNPEPLEEKPVLLTA